MSAVDGTAHPDHPGTDPGKAKFEQALARKRQLAAARGAAASGGGAAKIHGEHGAAGGRRTFRRKSGG